MGRSLLNENDFELELGLGGVCSVYAYHDTDAGEISLEIDSGEHGMGPFVVSVADLCRELGITARKLQLLESLPQEDA
tara:strand:- start:682 stop:915 length:234 start_codon:yes stop_codon:yes gene_type:complete